MFDGNTLHIEDSTYPLTEGLVGLLFSKNPKQYNNQDSETYKTIIEQTSAHLTRDGLKIRKSGYKYTHIIAKLFPPATGSGLYMRLQRNNLAYWNDPNELVERLSLLLSSQAAGNTGVSNEILSIFEELYEAGIIKRIPNESNR